MSPIFITIDQIVDVVLWIFTVAILCHYPVLIFLLYRSVNGTFPKILTKRIGLFSVISMIATVADLFMYLLWLTCFFCGRFYVVEGIACLMYAPMVLPMSYFSVTHTTDDVIKIRRSVLILALIAVTIFLASTMPYDAVMAWRKS